jgi:hypothetical protein
MLTPCREINVTLEAASTDDVRFLGNHQAENGFYDFEQVDPFRHKFQKPRVKLQDEIGPDLAVRVMFTKMCQRVMGVDAMSAIHTNEDHVLFVDDIWCAPEKVVINDRMLIRQNMRFMHVQGN